MSREWYVRCCVCGRFCTPADEGTPYGSCVDLEPPDPEFFCARCVAKQEAYYVEQRRVPTYWCKPEWVRRVAEKLGYVEVVLGMNAWTEWAKPDAIPNGWSRV